MILLTIDQGVVINNARELGGRLFASFIYGPRMYRDGNYFFWIPSFVPFM